MPTRAHHVQNYGDIFLNLTPNPQNGQQSEQNDPQFQNIQLPDLDGYISENTESNSNAAISDYLAGVKIIDGYEKLGNENDDQFNALDDICATPKYGISANIESVGQIKNFNVQEDVNTYNAMVVELGMQ